MKLSVAALAVFATGCAAIYEATHRPAPRAVSDRSTRSIATQPADVAPDVVPALVTIVDFELDETRRVVGCRLTFPDQRDQYERKPDRLRYTPTKQLIIEARARRKRQKRAHAP